MQNEAVARASAVLYPLGRIGEPAEVASAICRLLDGVQAWFTGQVIGAFRINSPLAGRDGPKPERHRDYIDTGDFPLEWMGRPLTVEVEAKAKELAVIRLIADLNGEGGS